MNSFKDALDDFDNRSEGERVEGQEEQIDDQDSTLYLKDKKCRALVWMKIHEYPLANSGI